ncbi:GNAT family N-acetyltransferase [Rossellomorea vietnamensis]|uniref:GNAT family N-acetyltransferase n=1 Tax=Rossellomorea vietnamensis TaxID=218284 RepID=A0A5D4MKQ2_9BACI|nr:MULTISPECIES: GNAT family N-acetyltransferase [Bacillaceae]TYS01571.1 GNAT family N-acetyltransferase [Rossellomorea vietnamensis]
MSLVIYTDADQFDEVVRPLLLREEAENNLPLGLLDQIRTGRYEDPFLAVYKEGETIHAVFVRTPPHYLIVTVFDYDKVAAIGQAMWEYTEEKSLRLPGFIGNTMAVEPLAEFWSEKTQKPYEVNMRQRIYKLQSINDIEISQGRMELADEKDIELVTEWLQGFTEDTPETPIPKEDARKRAAEMVEEDSVFLWKVDGVPVSMARQARKTDNGVTVNFVYTPRDCRRKGYGRSVVAKLSEKLLQTNQFCTLYTDLDNPTSNKIYMEIGYEPVCDSKMINL